MTACPVCGYPMTAVLASTATVCLACDYCEEAFASPELPAPSSPAEPGTESGITRPE